MPRVLHLFNNFGASTEATWLDVALQLGDLGYSPTIGYEVRSDDLKAPPNVPAVALKRIEVSPVADVDAQMRDLQTTPVDPAQQTMLDEPFDLIHGHLGTRVLHGAQWLRRGVPMVVSLYGYDASRLLRDDSWVRRYIWAAEHGAVFAVLDASMQDRLEKLGIPSQSVRLLPLGVDISDWAFAPRPAPAVPTFVFVGRLVPKKGCSVLIEAIARLFEVHGVEARLRIIGDGPDRSALEELVVSRGLVGSVDFCGFMRRSTVHESMAAGTALVLPSVTAADGDMEGTPITLMEAQAIGVPCVTTRHGGNPEVLAASSSAFLVSEGDVEGLAAALAQCASLAAEERRAIQMAGRRWIEDRYALSRTVAAYASLYAEINRHPWESVDDWASTGVKDDNRERSDQREDLQS